MSRPFPIERPVHGGATAPPHGPIGDRLAVVLGSSLLRSPFNDGTFNDGTSDRGTPEVHTVVGRDGDAVRVELTDHGQFLSLRRHGSDGRTPAHLVDHHAHVRALVGAGCDRVLAIGSSGSLRGDWPVGTLVAPDDLLALSTYDTFHDTTDGYGMRGFDARWRSDVLDGWPLTSRPVQPTGTYAQVQGPRFETPAEIRLLASFADLVGMTLAAECMLSSEAGLRYAAICQVDNLANGVAPFVGERNTATDVASPSAVTAYQDNTRALHEQFASEIVAAVHALTAAASSTSPTAPTAATPAEQRM